MKAYPQMFGLTIIRCYQKSKAWAILRVFRNIWTNRKMFDGSEYMLLQF